MGDFTASTGHLPPDGRGARSLIGCLPPGADEMELPAGERREAGCADCADCVAVAAADVPTSAAVPPGPHSTLFPPMSLRIRESPCWCCCACCCGSCRPGSRVRGRCSNASSEGVVAPDAEDRCAASMSMLQDSHGAGLAAAPLGDAAAAVPAPATMAEAVGGVAEHGDVKAPASAVLSHAATVALPTSSVAGASAACVGSSEPSGCEWPHTSPGVRRKLLSSRS